jgi:hypothetical protein
VLAGLAEAHLALGEPTEAVATAREGIDLGNSGGCLYNEALAQLALAAALLATDCVVPRAEIESALERAEHLVASIEGSTLSRESWSCAAAWLPQPATRRRPTGRCGKPSTSTARSAPPATPSDSRGSSTDELTVQSPRAAIARGAAPTASG